VHSALQNLNWYQQYSGLLAKSIVLVMQAEAQVLLTECTYRRIVSRPAVSLHWPRKAQCAAAACVFSMLLPPRA
jgi:hypothetical protein